MHNSVDPDSIIFRVFNRLGELVLLNLCFVVCCIPIVTIGPASTAMYTVCFRFQNGNEKHVVSSFFRAFRQNFRQGVALWLMLILFCVGSCSLALMLLRAFGSAYWGYIPSLLLVLVSLITAGYAFPLLSMFDNTCLATLKNALVLGLSYLPRSLCVVALNLAPLILLLTDLSLFLRLSILGVFLYFSGAAYVNALLLRKVMEPYLPKDPA